MPKFELDELVKFNVTTSPGEALIPIWEDTVFTEDNTYVIEDTYNDKIRFVGFTNFVHEDHVEKLEEASNEKSH